MGFEGPPVLMWVARKMDMTLSSSSVFARKPLYAVLFPTVETGTPYSPLVAKQQGPDTTVTVPHGFDREVAAALPGLWYCMHLPNDFLQLIDVPLSTIKTSQMLHLGHLILVAPIQVFDQAHIDGFLTSTAPVLVVCPDELIEDAVRRSTALGFPLPVARYSELSDESLKRHWRAIHEQFVPEARYFGYEPTLTRRLDLAPTCLPMRWLVRQMRNQGSGSFDPGDDLGRLVSKALGSASPRRDLTLRRRE